MTTRCPRCDSPAPHLHPAIQCEGEVQPCPDAFHFTVTNQNPPRLPAVEGPPDAAQEPNEDVSSEEFILDFLAAYYGFSGRAHMGTFESWTADIRDDVRLIQSWLTLKGVGHENGPSAANARRIRSQVLAARVLPVEPSQGRSAWNLQNAEGLCVVCGRSRPCPVALDQTQDRAPIDLDRRSIRTGCETEDNRRADLMLKQLGYRFDASEARWVKAAVHPGEPAQEPFDPALFEDWASDIADADALASKAPSQIEWEIIEALQKAYRVGRAEAVPSAIIDVLAEREHQDAQWGGEAHDDTHLKDDWLHFIRKQLDHAFHVGTPGVRDRLVKIAALAVAAIESHDRVTHRQPAVLPVEPAPADPRLEAAQGALREVWDELREVGTILRAKPEQSVIDAAHETMLALDLHESGALVASRGAARSKATCHDCGLAYEHFPLDVVLPNDQWQTICPEGGVLCAGCIVTRASRMRGVVVVRAQLEYADAAVLPVKEPPRPKDEQ